jgi:5'(3')-deoxyribonucleotidase
MTDKPIILLDMDGVIVDFIGGIIRSHDLKITPDDWSSFHWYRSTGMTDAEFWKPTYHVGWWHQLDEYQWSRNLFEDLRHDHRVIFCTASSQNANTPSEKVRWLRAHDYLTRESQDFQIGRNKWLNAKSGAILIDDCDEYVQEYRDAGGKAVLFPQPWNDNREYTDDRIGFVRGELVNLAKQTRIAAMPGMDFMHGQNVPDEPKDILEEALEITKGDRQNSYGAPDQDFARTARMWSALKGVDFEPREVAMFMIALKLSRETHQKKRDNAVDIAGYARCMDICNRAAELRNSHNASGVK